MENKVVCLCFDSNYAVFSVACIFSLKKVSPHLLVKIITPEKDLTMLHKMLCELSLDSYVEILAPPEEFVQQVSLINNAKGIGGYLRFCIPDLFAHEQKVLYIDSDIMALQDIEPLWEIDLEGKMFAAAQNLVRSPQQTNASDKYFNSGVLLFNIPELRRQQFAKTVISYIKENRRVLKWTFGDQDALNLLFKDSVVWISPYKWNLLVKDVTEPSLFEGASLVHFAGRSTELANGKLTDFGSSMWYSLVHQIISCSPTFKETYIGTLTNNLKEHFPGNNKVLSPLIAESLSRAIREYSM